jgi:hypothetical protein
MDSIVIEYVDHRRIYIPKLFYYPGGVILPAMDNKIKVTIKEYNGLMRQKNGYKDCFVIVKSKPVKTETEEAL